jgi:hypothetical protein
MIFYNSEKKKSVLAGGGPAVSPLGISTISPERSADGKEGSVSNKNAEGKGEGESLTK